MHAVETLIVGAGVTGTAIAHALAPDHDVLVVDSGQIAGGTTSRASGLISTPASYPASPEMGAYAVDFFRDLDGTGTFTYTERPKLNLLKTSADAEAYEALVDDLPGTIYTADEIAEQYDGMVDLSAFYGAVEYHGTGTIDAIDYTRTLKMEAEREGARFLTDTRVEEITVRDGVVSGVETEYGTIEADTVVSAVGNQTRALCADHIEVPIRSVRWEAIELRPSGTVDVEAYPMGSDPTIESYWRPINRGHLLVGGNATLATDSDAEKRGASQEFRDRVTDYIGDVLPAFSDADIVSTECCSTPDAASPDTLPIIDAPEEAPDGLVIATGFQRGGVLTSPCTGRIARSLVTGEACPLPQEPFSLSRFDDRSASFELQSIYAMN